MVLSAALPQRIILICGVSGVGKTHLIRSYVARHSEAITLSAGMIIAEARKVADQEFLRTLSSKELEQSQQLLIHGFTLLKPKISNSIIVLDAHTVIDNDEILFRIPNEVFGLLGPPDGIVHVQDDPGAIINRRQSDGNRVRPVRSVDHITEYQRLSLQAANEISKALDVQIHGVISGDTLAFESAIEALLVNRA